jgi:hypothetical protein
MAVILAFYIFHIYKIMMAAQTLTFGSYNVAFKDLLFKAPLILNDIKLLRTSV